MKKFLFIAILIAIGSTGFGQNYLRSENIRTQKSNDFGVVKFISFTKQANISADETEMLLKEIVNVSDNNTFQKIKDENDVFGSHHMHFKHYYNGVEVVYHSYSVHSRNGIVTSANGSYTNIDLPLDLSALKTASEIYPIGLANLGSNYSDLPEEFQDLIPKGRLVVLPKNISDLSEDKYAYEFVVASTGAGLEKIYMDANTGEILKKETIIRSHKSKKTVFTEKQTAYLDEIKKMNEASKKQFVFLLDEGDAETRYNGSKLIETKNTDEGFVLHDDTRVLKTKNGTGTDAFTILLQMALGTTPEEVVAETPDFMDNDNNWTSEEHSPNKDDGALDVHWSFSQTYDFFKAEYDRDGFDGANSSVTAFVHPTILFTPNNASWTSLNSIDPSYTGGFMFIGDGDYDPETGTGSYDILAALDVIAHEFGHGVDSAAGNLEYEKESGALDEGFADVWGSTIEADRAPEKQKWLIGEDFVMIEPDGIRSFIEPNMFNQPDTYKGDFWVDTVDCTPSSDNDNCGVHTNSGVLNHWYYLVSDGGSGTNDNDYEYAVTGMTIEKAADLVYSVETNYVQSDSGFADVADFTMQEAGVLYGEGSAEVQTVKDAWCAVGVLTGEACEEMGVSDLVAADFSVFPNPASNVLNINSKVSQNLTYKINNTTGQLMQQGKVTDNKINISVLPKGVYMISLKTGDSVQTIKFIKK